MNDNDPPIDPGDMATYLRSGLGVMEYTNGTPGPLEVIIETAAGSVIRFILPQGAEVRLDLAGDIVQFRLNVHAFPKTGIHVVD